MLGEEAAHLVVAYSSGSDLASVTHGKLLKPKYTFIHPVEAQSPCGAVTEDTERHRFAEGGVRSISMAGLGAHSSRE